MKRRVYSSSKRIFSGIQPTGSVHIGNYIGAIQNWVLLQERADSLPIYSIVDLHAITQPYGVHELKENVFKLTATLLACGINVDKSILFCQSDVKEHSELAWILSCITPLSWLQRMTQYKQKSASKSEKNQSSLGLLSYPVLQAADILLYKATEVPVGEDQLQHLELCRDIVTTFHHKYCREIDLDGNEIQVHSIFPSPIAIVSKQEASNRIMSLKDASKKMSKSDINPMSRINLTDSDDEIMLKIKGAKTDSEIGFTFDVINRPEKSNLLAIYSAFSGTSIDELVAKYSITSATDFKHDLATLLISRINPISRKLHELMNERNELERILKVGASDAREIAQQTIDEVRRVTGVR